MNTPRISLSPTRTKQLLAERRESLRILKDMLTGIKSQRSVLAHLPFTLHDLNVIVDCSQELVRSCDVLCGLMGPEPNIDDEPKIVKVFTSEAGQAEARQYVAADEQLDAALFRWEDGARVAREQLENAEPTAEIIERRALAHQISALCRHAEALSDTVRAVLYHYHLQFWVWDDGKVQYSGQESANSQTSADKSTESTEATPPAPATDAGTGEPSEKAATASPEEAAAAPAAEAAIAELPHDTVASKQQPPEVKTAKKRHVGPGTIPPMEPKRKLTATQRRLLRLHRRQLRFFDRTAAGLTKEFRKCEEAKDSLANVAKLSDMLHEQSQAADNLITVAQQVEGEGNITPAVWKAFFALVQSTTPPSHYFGVYDWMTNQRKMVEHMGEMDEWRLLLAAVYEGTKAARPLQKTNPQLWDAFANRTWRLSAGQFQIHCLVRQAEAITFTQNALFRSLGIKFWQGHKRYGRYEGDERTSY
jgi:hypothetical protein